MFVSFMFGYDSLSACLYVLIFVGLVFVYVYLCDNMFAYFCVYVFAFLFECLFSLCLCELVYLCVCVCVIRSRVTTRFCQFIVY